MATANMLNMNSFYFKHKNFFKRIFELPNTNYCNIPIQAVKYNLRNIYKCSNENESDEVVLNQIFECFKFYQNKYYVKFYEVKKKSFFFSPLNLILNLIK